MRTIGVAFIGSRVSGIGAVFPVSGGGNAAHQLENIGDKVAEERRAQEEHKVGGRQRVILEADCAVELLWTQSEDREHLDSGEKRTQDQRQ